MTQHKKENFLPGIEDKVVVITGASSGIGEATALLLAERGANVVLGRAERIALRLWRPASRMWAVKSRMHSQT